MNFFDYLGHVITYYELFITRLNELFEEAKLVDISKKGYTFYKERIIRINGFTIGNESGVLYLNVSKYNMRNRDNHHPVYNDYLPAEKMAISNNYTFGGGNIVAQNYEALESAVKLVKEFFESGILNTVSFKDSHVIPLEIIPKIDLKDAYIRLKNGIPTSKSDLPCDWDFIYFIKEKMLFDLRTSVYQDEIPIGHIRNTFIPEELLPSCFKELYQNRNLDLYDLNEDEVDVYHASLTEIENYGLKK